MSFKEKVYGRRTHDRPRPITIAHIEPLAQVSKKRGGTMLLLSMKINYILNRFSSHSSITYYEGRSICNENGPVYPKVLDLHTL